MKFQEWLDENWEKDRNGAFQLADSSYSDKETEKILAEGDFTEKQFNIKVKINIESIRRKMWVL